MSAEAVELAEEAVKASAAATTTATTTTSMEEKMEAEDDDSTMQTVLTSSSAASGAEKQVCLEQFSTWGEQEQVPAIKQKESALFGKTQAPPQKSSIIVLVEI